MDADAEEIIHMQEDEKQSDQLKELKEEQMGQPGCDRDPQHFAYSDYNFIPGCLTGGNAIKGTV